MKQIGIKFLLLLCLGITLGGCRKVEEKVLTYEEVQQEMLDYLEHKYNEEFEVHSMDYKSWYNGFAETMLAYPRGKNENYYFHVKRTGKDKITDDYVRFTMKKYYDKKVKEMTKNYFPEAVVRTGVSSSMPIPDSFRPNMDWIEFKKYADKVVTLGVTVYMVAETEADINPEKIQLLTQDLKTLNDIGGITFIGYSEEGFESSVLNDPFNSEDRNQGFSSIGEKVIKDVRWGQIDFDYKYVEDDHGSTH